MRNKKCPFIWNLDDYWDVREMEMTHGTRDNVERITGGHYTAKLDLNSLQLQAVPVHQSEWLTYNPGPKTVM